MVLVAVAVNFLVRGLKASQAETAASIRTLSEISEKQRELVDSLPGGIILTDESSKVTRLNRAAAILLGVSEDFALTKTLPTLLASVADKDSVHLPTSEKGGECTITRPTEKEPLRLSITSQQLSKTLHGTEGVLISLSNVTELRSIEEQLAVQERMARLLSEEQRDPVHHNLPNFQSFVGESQIMQKVFQLIQRVATSEATALIHGESGTGKELVARALHNGGRRSKGAFVPVNCGAIPENLIESELFGHMKGSFTGAESDHPGMFKQASGGTLFLDEIGELPIAMQAKLLRALQERSVRPVGSTRDIPIDVRIVAATNRNLKREVEAGRFREDLYYRLNVITISLPPLRDRKDDLPILMKAILNRLAGAGSLPVVSPQAMQLLLTYQYPGNVRELENILERAFVLGGQVILPEHLPEMMRSLPPSGTTGDLITAQPETQIIIDETIQLPANLDEILGQIERRYLETALLRSQGAKKRAADLLGINFRSFRYRLQKFGLSDS
jgi:two-component system response regulator PilR (NtrC family)